MQTLSSYLILPTTRQPRKPTYFRHPDRGPKDGRYQMDPDDGALRFGDVDLAEPQRTGHVRLPVGTVEQCHGAETLEEHPPRVVPQLDGYARRQGYEHRRNGVAPVVEQFPQRGRGIGTACLFAIDRVQALVDEQAQGTQCTGPPGRFLATVWTEAAKD